jgi:hypothetical protein
MRSRILAASGRTASSGAGADRRARNPGASTASSVISGRMRWPARERKRVVCRMSSCGLIARPPALPHMTAQTWPHTFNAFWVNNRKLGSINRLERKRAAVALPHHRLHLQKPTGIPQRVHDVSCRKRHVLDSTYFSRGGQGPYFASSPGINSACSGSFVRHDSSTPHDATGWLEVCCSL